MSCLCPKCRTQVPRRYQLINPSDFPKLRFYVPMGFCPACGNFTVPDDFLAWECPVCRAFKNVSVDVHHMPRKSQPAPASCWNCEWVRPSLVKRLFGIRSRPGPKALLTIFERVAKDSMLAYDGERLAAAIRALSPTQVDNEIAGVLVQIACRRTRHSGQLEDAILAARTVLVRMGDAVVPHELRERLAQALQRPSE